MKSVEEMKQEIAKVMNKDYIKYVRNSKKVAGSNYDVYGEDLLSFCITEFLLKKSIEYQYKVVVTDNKFANYMAVSMSINIKSSTSPYWQKNRKEAYLSRGIYLAETETEYRTNQYDITRDFDEQSQYASMDECMMWALSQLDFYHKELIIQYYFNKLTYNQIHKKYGITLGSISKDIKQAQKLIQQHCKHFI
jgi:DNA-directed RNA polymerase specialized sigma subunit